ncbi:MAG: hypothetical protein AAF790_02585 [Planctomycetota bacterium]
MTDSTPEADINADADADAPPARRHYTPGWSVLRAEGPDAAAFLHNMSTNHVQGLAVGAAHEALFTNVKARSIAHAVVCRPREEGFFVVVTSGRAAQLHTHLDRYHIREDLTLTVDADPQPVLVWGADGDGPPGFDLPVLGCRLCVDPASGGWGTPLGAGEFDTLRVPTGFPLDGVDVDEGNLPQELNRDAAIINFNKGCYLGQETVARIDALGRVAKLMVGVSFAGAPTLSAGDTLQADGRDAARVTTVAADASGGGCVALAYARREFAAAGCVLSAPGGEAGEVRAGWAPAAVPPIG